VEADRLVGSAARDLEIVRGEGAFLYDDAGRAFLDCGVSHGACNLGHAHPDVVRAIEAQARRLLLVDGTVRNDARAAFLDALFDVLPEPLGRAFLCNSGAESVEAALKFARSATGRSRFVAAYRAFHGRTFGALSVTWKREARDAFGPLLPDVDFVPFNDAEALKDAVTPATAAVILEPVQGEAGAHVADPGFLRTAADACADRGALLILDEVQTGFGRTGRLFAFERSGIVPDILCLAKSLAGGFPMGATIVSESVHAALRGGHRSTFGGNPLACAAGAASIRAIVRDRLWERADRLGRAFLEDLRAIPTDRIREVRGLGLLVAAELRTSGRAVLEGLYVRGILAIPAGASTVRFLPPLVIPAEDLRRVASAFEEALDDG
jgi:acetylornithine/LysW-gamma-L-lysine aminotransferase